MVAEPLVEAGDERGLDSHRKRHGAACDLGGEDHVEVVEIVVQILDLVACSAERSA